MTNLRLLRVISSFLQILSNNSLFDFIIEILILIIKIQMNFSDFFETKVWLFDLAQKLQSWKGVLEETKNNFKNK